MQPEGSCSFHAGCDTARAWTLVGHNVEVPDVCAALTSPRALTSPAAPPAPSRGTGTDRGGGPTEPLLGTGPGLGGHLSALWRQQCLCQCWQGSTWDGWQCDRTRGLGMLQGPVRVPGRGHRALGTHRGQPPAQPRAQRSRGRVSLRAKGTAGRAGTRQAGAVPRSEEPRGARGRCARGQGRWMSPLCRACPGCPLRGQRAGCAHACAHARLCAHTHRRAGPQQLRPAAFPNSRLDAAPLQPPRALP